MWEREYDERSSMQLPSAVNSGSFECATHRTAGSLVESSVTVAGTNDVVTTNVFQFTGSIELLGIWGILTDASDVTLAGDVYLDVYDGTNQIDITADSGAALTGVTVGSLLIKNTTSETEIDVLNSSQIRIAEATNNKRAFVGVALRGKSLTTNYLRMIVTTDANTDIGLTWYAAWRCLCGGSTFAAV